MTLIFTDASTNPSIAPLQSDGGQSQMERDQRAARIGNPVPVVWCRRRGTAGGVLLSPPATECRFANDIDNNVTASYHLLLSDGELPGVQVRDVFQGVTRRGTITQSYDQRAGQWLPGNALILRAGFQLPEATKFCGSVGRCKDVSTMSWVGTVDDPSRAFRQQIHLFMRGGIEVTRLDDDVLGSSDNYADLMLWLLRNSSRVRSDQIDIAGMTVAAEFTEANGFRFNGVIEDLENLPDLLERWSRYFLLRYTTVEGRHTLRPLLPLTGTAINTGVVNWRMTFNERLVLPESVQVNYVPTAERRSIAVRILWRQQLEDAPGFVRVVELRYAGTPADVPYEEHDLSKFVTTEVHAVKFGAYLLARRRYITHTISLSARPEWHSYNIAEGDIVRVNLQRLAVGSPLTAINWLYEVDRITKGANGDTIYEMTHFPLAADGSSIVAIDVDAAEGSGILLLPNRSGVINDENADDDETVPTQNLAPPTPGDPLDPGYVDTGLDPDIDYDIDPPIEVPLPEIDPDGVIVDGGIGLPGGGGDEVLNPVSPEAPPLSGSGGSSGGGGGGGGGGSSPGGGAPGEEDPEPTDPLDDPELPRPEPQHPDGAGPGVPLAAPVFCPEQGHQWKKDGAAIPGETGSSYTPGVGDIGSGISVEIDCPDGPTFETPPIGIRQPVGWTFPLLATSATFRLNWEYDWTRRRCDDNALLAQGDDSGTGTHTAAVFTDFGVGWSVTTTPQVYAEGTPSDNWPCAGGMRNNLSFYHDRATRVWSGAYGANQSPTTNEYYTLRVRAELEIISVTGGLQLLDAVITYETPWWMDPSLEFFL